MKTIVFGPWTGEFGYELSYWIGECRAIRKAYPDHRATASSYNGRARLYHDFTDEFLPHETPPDQATGLNMCWGQAQPHPQVATYLKQPGTVHIKPGMKYGGFLLGGGHGHVHIDKSVAFQAPQKLQPSDEALIEVDRILDGRETVCLMCRQLDLENQAYMWPEQNWKELSQRLLDQGKQVVSILPRYANKPVLLAEADNRIVDVGKLYGHSENLTDLQIAFITRSKCTVSTVTGAVMYGYLVGTPFLYLVADETRHGYRRLYDAWKSRYETQVKYLTTTGSVTVDKVIETIEAL